MWLALLGIASALELAPNQVELEAPPGSVVTRAFNVRNTSSERVEIRLYLEDWWYEGDKHRFEPVGSRERSAAVFSDVSRDTVTLAAGESTSVDLRVRVPDDAEGGYYTVLFAESALGLASMRLGALVMIETQGAEAPMLAVQETRYVDEGGAARLEIDGQLEGDTHGFVTVSGLVVDKDGGTGVVDRVGNEPLRFLPGQARTLTVPLDMPLEPGVYTFTGAAVVDRSTTTKVSTHFKVP